MWDSITTKPCTLLTKCPFPKTRRYGPLSGPTSSSCRGLQPLAEAYFAFGAQNELIMLFWLIFGNFGVQ